MHLTVVCPACQSQYQVDPSLRGKRMRCPNSICRTIFEVRDETEPESTATPPATAPTPIVHKDEPVSTPIAEPKAPPKWSAPPPVRTTSAPAAAAEPAPMPAVDDFDIPGDIPDDDSTSPPGTPGGEGRGEGGQSPSRNLEVSAGPAPSPPTPLPRSTGGEGGAIPAPRLDKKRVPLLIVAGLVVSFAIAATAVAVKFVGQQKQIESDLAMQADQVYEKGSFAEAMRLFQKLQSDYPTSKEIERYRFLATFSEMRSEADAAHEPVALADARKHALEFLEAHEGSPHFKAQESFEAFLPLAKRSVEAARESPEAILVAQVKGFWDRVRPLANRSTRNEDEYFQKTIADLRETLARRELREATLAHVQAALPTAAAIADAQQRVAAALLSDDAEIAAALKTLRDSHRAAIAFVPPEAPALPVGADPFSLIPFVAAAQPPQPARGGDPILGLSPTGILYALRARHGDLLWAHRLGIDSRFAPKRLGEPEAPARFLVVSNDRKTIAVLDGATGQTVWQHVLSAPAAAEPIVAPAHVLVSLVTGRVEVLNPDTGSLTGSFQFDQPLPYGGAFLPDTSLIALPGEAHCIYVLDLANRACVHVIETGHAAGSLIGPPIVVPDGGPKSWLILAQAEAGPRVKLHPIAYPPETAAKRPELDLEVAGTLSFPPRHDAESILLATEEGKLHRVGIRLRGNRADPLLFPLTPAEILLDAPPPGHATKAMVAHIDAENIWVISAGRLQRLQLSFSAQAGPIAKARWPQATWVGQPLHAAEVHADAEGTILFLATHDPAGPTAWLSAIDGETGKILWKTQLGSTPNGEPLQVDDNLIWRDGGRAFIAHLPRLGDPGAIRSLPLAEAAAGTLLRLGPPEKSEVLSVSWSPGQAMISVQRIVAAGPAPQAVKIALPAALAAPPVAGDDSLLAALANGALCRIDLKSNVPRTGPDWRAAGAEAGHGTQLLRVQPDIFVVADGAGGLAAFKWEKTWGRIASYRPAGRRLLDRNLLLPGDNPRLLAVDAGGQLILLDAVKLRPQELGPERPSDRRSVCRRFTRPRRRRWQTPRRHRSGPRRVSLGGRLSRRHCLGPAPGRREARDRRPQRQLLDSRSHHGRESQPERPPRRERPCQSRTCGQPHRFAGWQALRPLERRRRGRGDNPRWKIALIKARCCHGFVRLESPFRHARSPTRFHRPRPAHRRHASLGAR
jgi:hypothetical protein